MKIKGSKGSRPPPVHNPIEAPNTLRSKTTARLIDMISEGLITGLVDGAKSIYFDDIPVQNQTGEFNFEGVTFTERFGEPDQDPIPGFSESESEINLGQNITEGNPAVFIVNDPDIDAVRVKMAVPALYTVTELGDVLETEVEFTIEVQPFGGSFSIIKQPKIIGKTVGPYEQQHRIPLDGAAPWTVRVTRLTPDSTSSKLQTSLSLPSYTELIEAKLVYPDTALIALEIDSQLFGGRAPRRSYEIKGINIAVPSNYNPVTRIYTGIWDGTFQIAFSDNPAWVLYDILVNRRYGLGDFIDASQIDKFALFTIGQYCDELVDDGFGGTEPRFIFNAVINTRQEAYSVVNVISSTFRGMTFWASGAVTASQDAPADITRLVGPANVIGGTFSYEGSSLKARHSTVLVSWNDPGDSFKPAIEVVEDHDLLNLRGYRPVDVAAYGCTSRGQAHRFGKWILDSERFETETVKYAASYDHADAKPGDIIAISDPSRAGARLAGRIVDVSGNDVTLDDDYSVETGDQILIVDGTDVIETIPLTGNAASNIVQMSAPLLGTPVTDAMFLIQKTLVAPETWKIISNKEQEGNVFEIIALKHDPNKFDRVENNIFIDPLPTSLFPTGALTPVTDITLLEGLYKSNNAIHTRLGISFNPSTDPRSTLYLVEIRAPNNNWEILQISPSTVAEIKDAEPGLWDVAVTALQSDSEEGSPSSRVELLDFEVFGKTAPPADVENFQGNRRPDGIDLTWDEVADLDLVGYDIRQGADWETAIKITEGFVGTSLFITLDGSEQEVFLIRARDTSGILSENVTSLNSVLSPPGEVGGFFVVPQDSSILATWDAVAASGVEYEIRYGDTWESGQFLARTGATKYTTLFPVKDIGTTRFLIKAINRGGLFSNEAAFFVLGTAPFVNRNEIISRDEQALAWPGLKNQVEVDLSNLILSEVSPGVSATYGEYSVLVDLGLLWRARNWIEARTILISATALTWDDATFDWDSPLANVPWLPTADAETGAVTAFLAPKTAIASEVEEGWTLDNTLIGAVLATAPSESLNVSYSPARYHDGLQMSSFTKVAWSITIPAIFSIIFTIKYDEVPTNDVVYISLDSPGGYIELGFDSLTGETYLEDELGNRLAVTTQITVDQFATYGISQDTNKRRLMIYEVETGNTVADEGDLATIGAIDTIALHAV